LHAAIVSVSTRPAAQVRPGLMVRALASFCLIVRRIRQNFRHPTSSPSRFITGEFGQFAKVSQRSDRRRPGLRHATRLAACNAPRRTIATTCCCAPPACWSWRSRCRGGSGL